MTTRITIDSAGRVLLPKLLRKRLRLEAGDTLNLRSEGEQILISPVRQQPLIKKERGVWVYQGEPTKQSIVELIDQGRDARVKDILR